MRLLLFLPLLYCTTYGLAQPYSNTQDDWSGGPVTMNPVWEFLSYFQSSDSIHWQAPGSLTLEMDSLTDGFKASGELLSSILEINWPVDYGIWGYIYWSADTPAGTGLEFYLRASDYPDSLGEWYGPFTESYTDLSGIMPDPVFYLQYKVVLQTEDSLETPLLDWVSIEAFHPSYVDSTEYMGIGSLSIHPNPSYGTIFFSIPESIENQPIRIYDLQGRIAAVTNGNGSVNDLDPGLYFCRFGNSPSSIGLVILQGYH